MFISRHKGELNVFMSEVLNIVFEEGAYFGGVGIWGMIFLGRDQQKHPIPHLDSTQRGDTHIEEDAKQGRHRNHLEDGFHVNRNTWKSQSKWKINKRKCWFILTQHWDSSTYRLVWQQECHWSSAQPPSQSLVLGPWSWQWEHWHGWRIAQWQHSATVPQRLRRCPPWWPGWADPNGNQIL